MLAFHVHGGFRKDIFDIVTSDPGLTGDLAHAILVANFPDSIHEAILWVEGLDLEMKTEGKRGRDIYFRDFRESM